MKRAKCRSQSTSLVDNEQNAPRAESVVTPFHYPPHQELTAVPLLISVSPERRLLVFSMVIDLLLRDYIRFCFSIDENEM